MTQSTPRGRMPVMSEADIRRIARKLLVEHGQQAVTLRAIARELGVTAPALYRYFTSLDDLFDALRHDFCAELAGELSDRIAVLPNDGVVQFFAICRGFRRWALANPTEFTLVFASPGSGRGVRDFDEPFGRIFLAAAGRVLGTYDIVTVHDTDIPEGLRADLIRFREHLSARLGETGQVTAGQRLDLGVVYLMLQIWARLYGHVTLEVFGNYPVPLSHPETLFDAMLDELGRMAGLIGE